MSQTSPGSDPIYKRLYAFPDMVADLLRSLFPANALDAVDLRSLSRLPAEYVGDDFRRRHGDAVWRARMRSDSAEWLHVLVLLEFQSGNDRAMAVRVLEEMRMTLEERVSRWPEPWIRQGVEQGLAQGIEQGVAQGKAQGIEQGVAQGIEQGVRAGLDRQRALLRRQAEARFGAPTADRLFARLRNVEDPEWLADVGEVIVRCETGEDLLRHAGA